MNFAYIIPNDTIGKSLRTFSSGRVPRRIAHRINHRLERHIDTRSIVYLHHQRVDLCIPIDLLPNALIIHNLTQLANRVTKHRSLSIVLIVLRNALEIVAQRLKEVGQVIFVRAQRRTQMELGGQLRSSVTRHRFALHLLDCSSHVLGARLRHGTHCPFNVVHVFVKVHFGAHWSARRNRRVHQVRILETHPRRQISAIRAAKDHPLGVAQAQSGRLIDDKGGGVGQRLLGSEVAQ